jgi:group I intron endonuclease
MPYADELTGVYKVANKATGHCYVGQSTRVKKRVHEHFRLLRKNIHPNQNLQASFNEHGEKSFSWSLEVTCEDPQDLDQLEEVFLQGHAWFDERMLFNISDFAKTPMKNRQHSLESKKQISESRKAATFDYSSDSYRKTLKDARIKQWLSRPEFVAKVRFIVDNPSMSYAERGRVLGIDTSSVRKLALRYTPLKGTF